MKHAALVSLAILVACAPVYVRTQAIQGSKNSATVSGKLDDAAQSELNKRAKEACGGRDTYDFYCKVPAGDGMVVYWSCDHLAVQPSCPPQ